MASKEFGLASASDPRNVFVLLRWSSTFLEMAREAAMGQEHEAARTCAERAVDIAKRVLDFDPDNPESLRLLESVARETVDA